MLLLILLRSRIPSEVIDQHRFEDSEEQAHAVPQPASMASPPYLAAWEVALEARKVRAKLPAVKSSSAVSRLMLMIATVFTPPPAN